MFRYKCIGGKPINSLTLSALFRRADRKPEFELKRRLDEAKRVGVGFTVPSVEVAPSAPRISEEVLLELALQEQ